MSTAATSVNHPPSEDGDPGVKKVRQIDQVETSSAEDIQTIKIESLPESVLLLIFSSLDQVADRCSVARTCRAWHRIIKDAALWKDFTLRETDTRAPTVRDLISSGLSRCLLDLDVLISSTSCGFQYKPKFWQSFQNLETLRIPNIDLSVFDFELLPPSLKVLTIYTAEHSDSSYGMKVKKVTCSGPVLPNLEYFEVEDCQDVFANDDIQELHGLHQLLSSAKLHTVIIKLMHYFFRKENLAKIAMQLRNTGHVCFHSQSICCKGFKTLIAPLKSVKVLNLQFSDIEADTETVIVPCISSLRTLQEMYLSMFWELRPEHVKKMVAALPELNRIEIYRCRWIKKEHLAEIEKMKEGLKCEFPGYMRLSLI